MFKRILVPLDGSTLAEQSIPHAEQFARIFEASIILLQVIDPTSYYENPNPVDPLSWQIRKTEAELYLHGIAARIGEDLNRGATEAGGEKKTHVEYAVREGKAAENIVDFAHAEGIDLLVISTHGASGLSRWNISGVTEKVINLIYLPVLIVRAYNQSETDDAGIHYRRILLPIDSSRRAEYSLSAGIALARGEMLMVHKPEANGSSLHPSSPAAIPGALQALDTSSLYPKLILAAIIKPPEIPIPEPYPVEIDQLSEQLMQVSRHAVHNYLEEMKGRLPVECETYVVESHSVASAIQGLASQEDIDLVVLSAHGYTGQFTCPYGSITRNYMEQGTKPVLVIQDISRSQVRPTAAEIAAEKSGRR
jgi:nucleotide-binding universal stress UspA family protein